jgi:hypothetical protein
LDLIPEDSAAFTKAAKKAGLTLSKKKLASSFREKSGRGR